MWYCESHLKTETARCFSNDNFNACLRDQKRLGWLNLISPKWSGSIRTWRTSNSPHTDPQRAWYGPTTSPITPFQSYHWSQRITTWRIYPSFSRKSGNFSSDKIQRTYAHRPWPLWHQYRLEMRTAGFRSEITMARFMPKSILMVMRRNSKNTSLLRLTSAQTRTTRNPTQPSINRPIPARPRFRPSGYSA